jgi:hypothetical protein
LEGAVGAEELFDVQRLAGAESPLDRRHPFEPYSVDPADSGSGLADYSRSQLDEPTVGCGDGFSAAYRSNQLFNSELR